MPNLWSEHPLACGPDAARSRSGRHSASGGQRSSSDRDRARFGGSSGAKMILNVTCRHKEGLVSLPRLSPISGAWKAFSLLTGMLTLGAHPLRLRIGRELTHSGSLKC